MGCLIVCVFRFRLCCVYTYMLAVRAVFVLMMD